MPLDCAVWAAIGNAMDKNAPRGTETKADHLERLAKTARTLPRGFVRKAIGRMRANVEGVLDAGGYHAKND